MKTRKETAAVYKPYVMGQVALIPASYEEKIPEGHLVRVVNEAIEKLDMRVVMGQYKGGGTSSYHPKMMLKVIIYAYCERIYSSRRIAKALRENINFMWLSGENRPDYRTINEFRGRRMKGIIEDIFTAVLGYLLEEGYVKLENYFLDGTKIEADANKHKVVWEKRKEKSKQRVKEQIGELLKEIEKANEEEEKEYGEKDLEETGGTGGKENTSEKLKERMEELSKRLNEKEQKNEKVQSAQKALKKIEKGCLPRLEKYEEQEKILAGRNSYSQTDPDATCMRMKEDRGAGKAWPKPGYNIQCGTEGQFIVGYSIHNSAGDTACLISHLEGMKAKTV